MDAQMKRGFLDACVLATLLPGESYGYQIIKDAPPSLGLSESTLYPLLKRLETRGLIRVRKAEHNGRLRKYYSLTPEGNNAVREFLEDQAEVLSLYRFIQQAALNSAKAAKGSPADSDCAPAGQPDGAPPPDGTSSPQPAEPDSGPAFEKGAAPRVATVTATDPSSSLV
uniref:PadR family transcriptional regulator n=1 Tax=Muribaculaceae bacterium Z82 TaxID=2304548 RepID=A0A7C9NLT8_9BACT